MNKMTNAKVNTRPQDGLDAVETNLTINWDGMADEDVQALAQQALIVKLQSNWRRNGIPSGDAEVNAVDFKVGARAKREAPSIEAMLQKLSAEERAALLAKFAG